MPQSDGTEDFANLLVFGETGQLARELQRLAPQAMFLGRDAADLTNPAACADAVLSAAPAMVINAAAYTAVDAAETDEATAQLVNGAAPTAIARACAQVGAPLVHVSTDYVFDGAGSRAFMPNDPVAPLGAYGRTKSSGEGGIRAAGGVHAILRTSWVFSAHGANFVRTMLRLSQSRDALNIVADQIGGPTPARDLAHAALTIAVALRDDPAKSGSYHFAGAPAVSWADFATAIFEIAQREVAVTGIPTAEYPTPALRPLNSRLDCSSTEATFGVAPPDWRAALADVIKDLGDTDL